ncbi:MAG TPA: maleylpyruvate isomerase family mycothiol-dependent enzyme [Jatrophihabitantaceae bacterium]|jgi:maleylpyruvate isomerase
MIRHDVQLTRDWMRSGTEVLTRTLDPLPDAELDRPSALPGWTRRHVVAHLARNAEALARLLAWARTGVPTPMYASPEQRSSEIESSAQFDLARLRREFAETAAALDDDVAALSDGEWQATVRSARGREIPAAEVPWMRAREVWLHALDLDAGVGPGQLPPAFSAELVDDVVGFFTAGAGAPAVRLSCAERTWSIGVDGPLIQGEPAYLASWLTGRSEGEGLSYVELPELPKWL